MFIFMRAVSKDEHGFSLLGALIGMAIFVIGILAVFAMQTRSITSTGNSAKLTQAGAWAQDYVEMLISLPYDDPALDASNDPLEPVSSFTGGVSGVHQAQEGPYTVSWAVLTNSNNLQNLTTLGIASQAMFDGVDKTQLFQDILPGSKLIVVHVSHPLGAEVRLVFLKSNS